MNKEEWAKAQFYLRAGAAAQQRWPGVVNAQIIPAPDGRMTWVETWVAHMPAPGVRAEVEHEQIDMVRYKSGADHELLMGYGPKCGLLVVYKDGVT